MQILTDVLNLILLNFLAVLSPGPNLALVIKNSTTNSYKRALLTILGIISSLSIQIFLCIIGLGVIIQNHPHLFSIIKVIGGIYLIYLGLSSFKQAYSQNLLKSWAVREKKKSGSNDFLEGFLCNTLNVNIMVFILFLFSTIITPKLGMHLMVLYGVTTVLAILASLWLIAFLISRPMFKSIFSKIQWHINMLFGIVLVALGALAILN